MGLYGDGATIRFDHAKSATVWTEGAEAQPAFESYDFVSEVAEGRRFDAHANAFEKQYGTTP
jgi:hypothetical protein